MIKFDELDVGDKFIIKEKSEIGDNWTGMKCVDKDGKSHIVDLSDVVGLIVSDVYEYTILERV